MLPALALGQSPAPNATPAPASAPAPPPASTPAAASESTAVTVRDALVQPLARTQDLLREGKPAQALQALSATDAVTDKTPLETYVIERMRAAGLSATGDNEGATRALERALGTGQTPAAEEPALADALMALHYNARRYEQAAQWAERALRLAGTPAARREPVRMVLAQSLYLSGQYAQALTELQTLIRAAEQAGRAPPQNQLDLFASSFIQLKDESGYLLALERLLRWYPRKDYWADLLTRLERVSGFARERSIDLFRLQAAAGALTDANDYLEYAQLALKAGFHAESRRALAAGFEAGVLGKGDDAERHKGYLSQVGERADDELRQLNASPPPPEPASTDALFELGWRLHTHGQSATGITRMQQALDKGDIGDIHAARLRLGNALLASGDKARAREVFQRVEAARLQDGGSDLARLWQLLTR